MERLGGIDIDQAVLAHVDAALDGLVSAADSSAIHRCAPGRPGCATSAAGAKEALSTDTDTSIPVSLPGVQTEVRLTRDELEPMVRPRVAETVQALERAIRSTGLALSAISRVLLVGGSSRIPAVAQLVRERTGIAVAVDAHPKFAIATGAALLGAAGSSSEPRTTGCHRRDGTSRCDRAGTGERLGRQGRGGRRGRRVRGDSRRRGGVGPRHRSRGVGRLCRRPAWRRPRGRRTGRGADCRRTDGRRRRTCRARRRAPLPKPAATVKGGGRRVAIAVGAVAGVALAAVAVVVLTGGDDGATVATPTTVPAAPGPGGDDGSWCRVVDDGGRRDRAWPRRRRRARRRERLGRR